MKMDEWGIPGDCEAGVCVWGGRGARGGEESGGKGLRRVRNYRQYTQVIKGKQIKTSTIIPRTRNEYT